MSGVLVDCVRCGASVSFLLPFTHETAHKYWSAVSADVTAGRRIVFVAEDAAGATLGTVSVLLDQPQNQPHRGDVSKMLVHPSARRRGVGAQLLAAAERSALQAGKTLLVLDTASDDAERLYERAGWRRCGRIPLYALMPDGTPCATTVYFKLLHEFRPYGESDLPSCLAVFDANCPEYFAVNERADYEKFLNGRPNGYTVCVAADQVVGAFGLFNPSPGRATLNWILISPHVHGSGVGSSMMRQAVEQARRSGASSISIAASHKSAPFFAGCGAIQLSETPDGWGPGMHRIDMELRVGASPSKASANSNLENY